MKAIITAIASLSVACFVAADLQAHPGQDHSHSTDLHVWKDAEGTYEVEGCFLLVRDEKALFCKHDGTLATIPLAQLSREDRGRIQKQVDESESLNRLPERKHEDVAATPSLQKKATAYSSSPAAAIAGSIMVLLAVVGLFFTRNQTGTKFALLLLALLGSLTMVAASPTPSKLDAPPAIQKYFEPFKNKLELRSDADYLYVGSNGFPDHPMMVGIKAWQQQVPLPQPYTGKNAWQIPLKPKLAEKPISAKKALYRGAIALAVNGVPIFNALNNRGEDAFLAGELDEYGGHCGRGDDYHYHIAPVHLEKIVGKGNPIAYALDGFPLYGYTDAQGQEPRDLDEYNGRMEKEGYRYYSTKKYPYINGGMRGEVTVRGDQIEPQPRDAPVRPAGQPLRGAKITEFTRDDDKKTYLLKYEVQGKTRSVKYTINKDATYTFVFADGNGQETTETYRRRERK